MHLFGKTSLVDIAVGFAIANHYDASESTPVPPVAPSHTPRVPPNPTELFRAIEDASAPYLPDLGPAYMSELLWSLATVNHVPSPNFLAVRAC